MAAPHDFGRRGQLLHFSSPLRPPLLNLTLKDLNYEIADEKRRYEILRNW